MARFGRKKAETKRLAGALPSETTATPIISPTASRSVSKVSTYHVYHEGEFHHRLTPERDAYKDKVWPSWSETRSHLKEKREKRREKKLRPADEKDPDLEAPGFFVHKPRICCNHPPRTLRLGQSKRGTPLCLIHNSWFWRRWEIQFCNGLDKPGVVDPRGTVGSAHGYANRQDFIRRGGNSSNSFVQGYPVKKWRIWGDTGKQYHRSINEQRKGGKEQVKQTSIPLELSTAVTLNWDSPFTNRTRRYSFRYENLDFRWKGTSTVKYPGFWGFFTRFNHLKLVVKVPAIVYPSVDLDKKQNHILGPDEVLNELDAKIEATIQTKEVVLATYTSSPAARKAGTLEIHDDALIWILKSHIPSQWDHSYLQSGLQDDIKCFYLDDGLPDPEQLAKSQLYECVVATALCMVIAEHQKREWIRHIMELAAGEAGAGGG